MYKAAKALDDKAHALNFEETDRIYTAAKLSSSAMAIDKPDRRPARQIYAPNKPPRHDRGLDLP